MSLTDITILAPVEIDIDKVEVRSCAELFSVSCMKAALSNVNTSYVAMSPCVKRFKALPESVSFMVDTLEGQEAVMVYANYVTVSGETKTLISLADPERYVVRDSFDFGPLLVMRTADAVKALSDAVDCRYSAFYSLTLGLQRIGELYRSGVPVGLVYDDDVRDSGVRQFDYVDPRNSDVQAEREAVFSAYLASVGALLTPEAHIPSKTHGDFSCRASVVIPVKNRVGTISDAIESALRQHTSFDFNVIVVDNHSTDGTSEAIEKFALANDNVIHIIPKEDNLGIGGCWNLAVADSRCGKCAVQLDSDDLYSSDSALQTMVDKFAEKDYALVVGSYKLVDFALNEIPPGVIDHKEWTDSNGFNNILRINGMGAPRAFSASWLRKHPFPNVSYGEDYAAVLSATRRFLVGRIFSVLYLCRRWGGNSDAGLSRELQAAHDAYKDKLRSDEVEARIEFNKTYKG